MMITFHAEVVKLDDELRTPAHAPEPLLTCVFKTTKVLANVQAERWRH